MRQTLILLSGTISILHVANHWVFAAPANDNFSASIAISGSSGQITATNTAATVEAGEPNHADTEGGASVWWSWTAPVNGTVAIDTFGSDFDTLLATYTGGEVSALTPIAANDDSGTIQSKMVFKAAAGTTYRIAVDGYRGTTGNIILNWQYGPPPINDDFSSAITITSSSHQLTANNSFATFETGEPSHADTDGGGSVWWKWTAPSNGTVSFNTFGSNFDTLLAAYTGSVITNLTPISANDDFTAENIQSQITFEVTSGTTYWIAVDGYNGDRGDITLNVGFVQKTPIGPLMLLLD